MKRILITLSVAVAVWTAVFACVAAVAADKGKHFVESGVTVFPGPGEMLEEARPVTGADFRGVMGADGVKPLLFLDGADITAFCDVNAGYVFCSLSQDLEPGEHYAVLKLERAGGQMRVAADWGFIIGWDFPMESVYPPAGSTVSGRKPVIGINFEGFPLKINPEKVSLILDGMDISSKCRKTDSAIFFVPDYELPDGAHSVIVYASAVTGKKLDPVSWKFAVAGGGAPDEVKAAAPKRKSSAAVIAQARRKTYTISRTTQIAENFYADRQKEAEEIRLAALAPTEEELLKREIEALPPREYAEAVGIDLGTEYALETTYGYENMDVGGEAVRSSQRERNALVYRLGLRTQTTVLSPSRKPAVFYTTFKMEGTSDADVTESLWDVKNFNAKYQRNNFSVSMYEIRPKYTTYVLSGQPLLGGEYQLNMSQGNEKLSVFGGKFKKNRAGKRTNIYGLRYTVAKPDDNMEYGLHYVVNGLTTLRGGETTDNSLLGFNYEKKYRLGNSSFEWARSSFTGLGKDTAYKMEATARKDKAYLSAKYESVGSYFRTESGFASKGLVELSTSMQYQYSKRLTSVLGFKRRSFRDGGSRTVSTPFILKFLPDPEKPGTNFEYKKKISKYSKGSTTKDTFTDTYSLRHVLRSTQVALSYQNEKKERNQKSDENERVANMTLKRPLTAKMDFTYKLDKLNNNFYGPETKNSYKIAYELSDWSDFSLDYQTINKDTSALDRQTMKFRIGKVNPATNTEMSFEFLKNSFFSHEETYSNFKYSVFY